MMADGSEKGGKLFLIEEQKTGQAVTFTDTGDLVGWTGHPLENGNVVQFSSITTTTGIDEDTNYYVINASENSFQVSATLGGSALELTTDGTGVMNYWRTLGGLRSKSISCNSESIDVTNDDSQEWRKILSGAGVRSCSISGGGVFKNSTIQKSMMSHLFNNTHPSIRFVMVSASGLPTDFFSGSWKVTTLDVSGEYNGEATYSMSFESADTIAYTAA